MRLVNYNSTQIYRLWDPKSRKLTPCRDVEFDEQNLRPGEIAEPNSPHNSTANLDLSEQIQEPQISINKPSPSSEIVEIEEEEYHTKQGEAELSEMTQNALNLLRSD